jgi:hypothetical protein
MDKSQDTQVEVDETKVDPKRRAALAKLGLAVGTAYLAPTVFRIDRSAHAMGPSCANNPKFCT